MLREFCYLSPDSLGLHGFEFDGVPALYKVVGLALQPYQGLSYCIDVVIGSGDLNVFVGAIFTEGLTGCSDPIVHYQDEIGG